PDRLRIGRSEVRRIPGRPGPAPRDFTLKPQQEPPKMTRLATTHRILALTLLAALATGCASYRTQRSASLAEAREDWDEAVVHYLELTDRQPGNVRWRSALLRAKLRASQAHFAAGRRFVEAGVPERAVLEFQQAAQLDPTNQYAQVELDKARAAVEAASLGSGAPTPTLDELKRQARETPAQPPML